MDKEKFDPRGTENDNMFRVLELTPEEEKLKELYLMIDEARLIWKLDNLMES